jgi:hypothetical protein
MPGGFGVKMEGIVNKETMYLIHKRTFAAPTENIEHERSKSVSCRAPATA